MQRYTFVITAVNIKGSGTPSLPSNAVTPGLLRLIVVVVVCRDPTLLCAVRSARAIFAAAVSASWHLGCGVAVDLSHRGIGCNNYSKMEPHGALRPFVFMFHSVLGHSCFFAAVLRSLLARHRPGVYGFHPSRRVCSVFASSFTVFSPFSQVSTYKRDVRRSAHRWPSWLRDCVWFAIGQDLSLNEALHITYGCLFVDTDVSNHS